MATWPPSFSAQRIRKPGKDKRWQFRAYCCEERLIWRHSGRASAAGCRTCRRFLHELAFAHPVAGKIAEPIVSSVLIGLAKCGVVEDLLYKVVNRSVVVEDHHPDVDQFCGVLADDAHSEKSFIGAREDEFQHSRGVAGDVAAGVVGIKSAS